MTDTLIVPIELRAADEARPGPGRLFGTLLTYGERAADRPEVFEPGSLTWPADGVVLRRQHVRAAPIARVVPEVRGGAVVIDQSLPDTAAGRDAAAEVRAGLFRGLSIEFHADSVRHDAAGVRRILAGRLGRGRIGRFAQLRGIARRSARAAGKAARMAVTIGVVELAGAIECEPGHQENLRLHAAAVAIVDRYAAGAPEAISNEAAIRVAGLPAGRRSRRAGAAVGQGGRTRDRTAGRRIGAAAVGRDGAARAVPGEARIMIELGIAQVEAERARSVRHDLQRSDCVGAAVAGVGRAAGHAASGRRARGRRGDLAAGVPVGNRAGAERTHGIDRARDAWDHRAAAMPHRAGGVPGRRRRARRHAAPGLVMGRARRAGSRVMVVSARHRRAVFANDHRARGRVGRSFALRGRSGAPVDRAVAAGRGSVNRQACRAARAGAWRRSRDAARHADHDTGSNRGGRRRRRSRRRSVRGDQRRSPSPER